MNYSNSELPLVSVLMTAYNREKYIAEAIESIIHSTYKNWELIIVDDRSDENTVKIAKEYEDQDERIRVYINESNLGDYPNRNKAESYAKGKYIKYVDADDLIYPHGLEVMVSMMEQFPNAGIGIGSFLADYYRIYPFQLSPEEAYQRHYFNSSVFHKSPLSTIINREKFRELGGFSGKRMVGDFEMWYKIAAKFPVVLLPHGLVWYRRHNNQEMRDYRQDRFIPFSYSIIELQMLNSEDCPLDEKDKKAAIRMIKKRQLKNIFYNGIFNSSTYRMLYYSFLFNSNNIWPGLG
jgi:glycosyltransferase involved in cell wall biosynthesis